MVYTRWHSLAKVPLGLARILNLISLEYQVVFSSIFRDIPVVVYLLIVGFRVVDRAARLLFTSKSVCGLLTNGTNDLLVV